MIFLSACKLQRTSHIIHFGKEVLEAMLPNSEVKTENLHEALDGDKPMKFHYVSVLAEIKRMLGNPAYSGKMYTSFEYEAMR